MSLLSLLLVTVTTSFTFALKLVTGVFHVQCHSDRLPYHVDPILIRVLSSTSTKNSSQQFLSVWSQRNYVTLRQVTSIGVDVAIFLSAAAHNITWYVVVSKPKLKFKQSRFQTGMLHLILTSEAVEGTVLLA